MEISAFCSARPGALRGFEPTTTGMRPQGSSHATSRSDAAAARISCLSLLDQARISVRKPTKGHRAPAVRRRLSRPARHPNAHRPGRSHQRGLRPAITPTASLAVAWVGVICSTSSARRSASRSACCSTISSSPGYAGGPSFVPVFLGPNLFATIGYGLRFSADYAAYSMLVGSVLMNRRRHWDSPFWRAQPYMTPASSSVPSPPVLTTAPRGPDRKSREHAENQGHHFERAASTDLLSGLLSRRGFSNEVLEQHISSAGTSALLYIDLDGLPGRSTTAAGTTSATTCWPTSRIACTAACAPATRSARIGGDEFAVLVTNLLESTMPTGSPTRSSAIGAIRAPDHPGSFSAPASASACPIPRRGCRFHHAHRRHADVPARQACRQNLLRRFETAAPTLANA